MEELQLLIETLLCGDDDLALKAVESLASFGEGALARLQELSTSPNPDIRWWVTRAFAGISHQKTPGLLRTMLQDSDNSVKQCAALALQNHPTPDAIPDLVALLASKDRLLARLAAGTLVSIGTAAVPELINAMEHSPQLGRLEAVRALAHIGDQRAIPIFFKAVKDGDSNLVEYWSDIGLQNLGIGMMFFEP